MSRRGFSLVKLLLILAVIAILIGLLLPATQKVREAANRTRSANNLKQVGIAFHNYVSVTNRFPIIVAETTGLPDAQMNGPAFFQILPYVEQDNVYKIYDAQRPASYYDAATGATRHVITTYLNPSDPSAPAGTTTSVEVAAPLGNKFTGNYATTSYCGNALLLKPKMNFPNITDGTSNTSLFTERYQVCQFSEKASDVVYNLWGMGAYSAATPAFALAKPDGDKFARTTAKELELKQFSPPKTVPLNGAVRSAAGVDFAEIAKSANAPSGFQVMPRGVNYCDPRIPQSPHSGIINVAFGDGAVRSLRATMSFNNFWAAATPNGGEVVELDSSANRDAESSVRSATARAPVRNACGSRPTD